MCHWLTPIFVAIAAAHLDNSRNSQDASLTLTANGVNLPGNIIVRSIILDIAELMTQFTNLLLLQPLTFLSIVFHNRNSLGPMPYTSGT